MENKSQLLATKEDISLLKQDVAKLETKIREAKVACTKWSIALWGTTI
jgi:hypothetical protein